MDMWTLLTSNSKWKLCLTTLVRKTHSCHIRCSVLAREKHMVMILHSGMSKDTNGYNSQRGYTISCKAAFWLIFHCCYCSHGVSCRAALFRPGSLICTSLVIWHTDSHFQTGFVFSHESNGLYLLKLISISLLWINTGHAMCSWTCRLLCFDQLVHPRHKNFSAIVVASSPHCRVNCNRIIANPDATHSHKPPNVYLASVSCRLLFFRRIWCQRTHHQLEIIRIVIWYLRVHFHRCNLDITASALDKKTFGGR